MTLTDILLEEHHHIERLISLFGIVSGDFTQGQPVGPDFFIEAGRFIQVYVDGQHHRKEEGILFPAIAPYMAKAVEALLAEHELARGFTRGMMGSASAWKNGDETAAQETIKEARNYAALMHDHILHENDVVYPATNWLIPRTEQAHLDELCAQMENENTVARQFTNWLDAIEAQTPSD